MENWIAMMKEQAQQGDIMSIILEGSRINVGDYSIGKKQIHPSVLHDLLSDFKTGVQVNVISGACPGLFEGVI